MMFAKPLKIATSAAAIAAVALVPATAGAGASAKKPQTKKVGVFDNYYEPAKLTVPKGSTIRWQWPITTGDSHDVTLDKGPKGVKRFQSEIAASEYVYTRKLTVAGKYHIICSLHQEMTMDITVR